MSQPFDNNFGFGNFTGDLDLDLNFNNHLVFAGPNVGSDVPYDDDQSFDDSSSDHFPIDPNIYKFALLEQDDLGLTDYNPSVDEYLYVAKLNKTQLEYGVWWTVDEARGVMFNHEMAEDQRIELPLPPKKGISPRVQTILDAYKPKPAPKRVAAAAVARAPVLSAPRVSKKVVAAPKPVDPRKRLEALVRQFNHDPALQREFSQRYGHCSATVQQFVSSPELQARMVAETLQKPAFQRLLVQEITSGVQQVPPAQSFGAQRQREALEKAKRLAQEGRRR